MTIAAYPKVASLLYSSSGPSQISTRVLCTGLFLRVPGAMCCLMMEAPAHEAASG